MTHEFENRPPDPLTAGLPLWARLILTLGLPTFLVLVSVGVFLGHISSPLTMLQPTYDLLVVHEARRADQEKEQTRLLKQICRNVAKSEVMAEKCER